MNLGTTDALEQPTEGTPKFGAIEGSEASTCKRLRSGKKAHGMPSGGPTKRGHKQKKIQHNQGATSTTTADLTRREYVGSEDSTCGRIRSGKVHGMPSSGPMNRGHKQKIHQEPSSKQMVNQRAASTADLTSHENVG